MVLFTYKWSMVLYTDTTKNIFSNVINKQYAKWITDTIRMN